MVCRKTASPRVCRKTISVQSSTRTTTRAVLTAARSGRTNSWSQHWTLREFKTYGTSIVPATVKSNPGNACVHRLHRKILANSELADYLVSRDALDNIERYRKYGKDAGDERSVYTFAFALTTPALDHLNSFDSDEREDDGDVVATFRPREVRSQRQWTALQLKAPYDNIISCVESGPRRAPDATTTAMAIRNSGSTCPEGWPSTQLFRSRPRTPWHLAEHAWRRSAGSIT